MLTDYVIRASNSLEDVEAEQWDLLLDRQRAVSPFMRHSYLSALHSSSSACNDTGWITHCITLLDGQGLAAACVVYVKSHSYGEYVFDWAWANAYARHGLDYYPKALVAVPFTPVPGARLLARDNDARCALVKALIDWSKGQNLSSLHLLFCSDDDIEACKTNGLMLRHTVQFHWNNKPDGYLDFEDFLGSLNQEKRKKIRQEQRKVREAGVTYTALQGNAISTADWDFFYHCYTRTYLEHGNAPYLTRDFFERMAHTMQDNWLLFIASRQGVRIACSLIGLQPPGPGTHSAGVAYGRYWGALERVDCLHFDACYYQPLAWCIAHGYQRFEGGAQGEHKMARALLPVKTTSAHWLAHPAFSNAVQEFLSKEEEGIDGYLDHLKSRSPLREV